MCAVSRKISLSYSGVGDQSIEQATSGNTDEVSRLLVEGNRITAHGVKLLSRVTWNNLTVVNFGDYGGGNMIGDIGCRYLTKVQMPKIEEVHIGQNQVSFIGVSHLAKAYWPKLTSLTLSWGTNKMKGCVDHLALGNWPAMEYLGLARCAFPQEQMTQLVLCDWPQISKLDLWDNLKMNPRVTPYRQPLITQQRIQANIKSKIHEKWTQVSTNLS